ncbi:MAG TPA: hypothetical protein VGP08_17340 [Pyrinomonadaceae bacterium]|jgi:hypothetical protein|nr:hypothetical protein [Pyrinomonadaceae bacterium]
MKKHVRKDSQTPRRSFLKVAAFTAGALAASPLLERATPKASAAPANEHGELHLPFVPGFGPPPGDMVVDFARQTRNAYADVRWNKSANKVSISYHYENLPYRPTVHRVPGTNPSNPFTPDYPETVVAAAYQFWLITLSARLSVFYYDRNTLGLIGNDLENPPADALVLALPMVRIVPTKLVEPTPAGVLDYTSNLKYDRVLDGAGNGGSEAAFGPTSLRNAGELSLVTSKVVPASGALPFDKFLESPGFALDTTVEPNPKPFALSQFNPMVVSGALSGFNVPEGFRVDTLVTNQLIQYTAAELSGAYVRPLVPGVSAC